MSKFGAYRAVAMRAVLTRLFPDRRRALSFGLALAIELALIVAILLWQPFTATQPADGRRMTTFDFAPDADKSETAKATPRKAARQAATTATPSPAPPPLPIERPPIVTPPSSGGLKGVLPIELGASDIGKLGRRDGDAGSGDSKLPYGPGEGPNGQPLYPVEWYREPTDAELGGYLPRGAPPGSWALIACQTAERYHVENCRQLGESPVGSGLSRAMRQASWQFLVRPPRRGGQPIPHAWVKILITFGEKPGKDAAPDGE